MTAVAITAINGAQPQQIAAILADSCGKIQLAYARRTEERHGVREPLLATGVACQRTTVQFQVGDDTRPDDLRAVLRQHLPKKLAAVR